LAGAWRAGGTSAAKAFFNFLINGLLALNLQKRETYRLITLIALGVICTPWPSLVIKEETKSS